MIGGGHQGQMVACYLQDAGLETAIFERQHKLRGTVFDDQASIITDPAWIVADPVTARTEFSTQNWDKTIEAITRFSPKDAETAQVLIEKYQTKWRAAYRQHMHSAPTPLGEKDAIERLLDDPESGLDPIYQFMPFKHIAHDIFESDEMRCFHMRAATTSTGLYPRPTSGTTNQLV